MTEAARRNGVTTSAVSQQLRELEERLGRELVDRTTRPATLTEAGKRYHGLCRDILAREREFLERLQGGVAAGSVKLVAIYSGLWEIEGIEDEFKRRFPQAKLTVEYLRPDKVYEEVLQGRADLGIVSYAEAKRELTEELWREERMIVAVGNQHPLAHRKQVRARDLAGEMLVGFDAELPIQRDIERYLRENKVRTQVGAHFDNIAMVKEAVAANKGLSILPEVMIRPEVDRARINVIKLTDPPLFRPVSLIYRKRQPLTAAAKGLLSLMQRESRETMSA